MKELKLHSSGQKDHLASLRLTYVLARKNIKANENLSETEKNIELLKLTKSFEKEKREGKNRLY